MKRLGDVSERIVTSDVIQYKEPTVSNTGMKRRRRRRRKEGRTMLKSSIIVSEWLQGWNTTYDSCVHRRMRMMSSFVYRDRSSWHWCERVCNDHTCSRFSGRMGWFCALKIHKIQHNEWNKNIQQNVKKLSVCVCGLMSFDLKTQSVLLLCMHRELEVWCLGQIQNKTLGHTHNKPMGMYYNIYDVENKVFSQNLWGHSTQKGLMVSQTPTASWTSIPLTLTSQGFWVWQHSPW